MVQRFSIGSSNTSPFVKISLILMGLSTLAWSLCSRFFPFIAQDFLSYFFTLSVHGIHQGFIWELFTYPLAQPMSQFNFYTLIDVLLKGYLFWIFAGSILETKGAKPFGRFIASSTLLIGAFAYCALLLMPATPYFGASALIYALMVSWMMLHPGAKLYLFFSIPVNVSTLIVGLFSIHLFLDLVNGDFLHLATTFAALLSGYFYSLAVWKLRSPFKQLSSFENWILNLRLRKKRNTASSKIYDFKTGRPIYSESTFMDAMFEKISKHGEESLTKEEKRKMDQIAKNQSSRSFR